MGLANIAQSIWCNLHGLYTVCGVYVLDGSRQSSAEKSIPQLYVPIWTDNILVVKPFIWNLAHFRGNRKPATQAPLGLSGA
jgi:hypothetical protein